MMSFGVEKLSIIPSSITTLSVMTLNITILSIRTEYNSTQHNNTQYNNTQHNNTQQNNTQHNPNRHNNIKIKKLRKWAELPHHFSLTLSWHVIILTVIMLIVVAPFKRLSLVVIKATTNNYFIAQSTSGLCTIKLFHGCNGTTCFGNCKLLLKYQSYLLLMDIWW
jgi:hypothetical protein